jgi:hypothetical protein
LGGDVVDKGFTECSKTFLVKGGVIMFTKHWMLRETAHCSEGCRR